MNSISVLICTFNRHVLLEQALDALLVRTVEKPDQVVVVNGGDERADQVVMNAQNLGATEVKLVKTVNVNLAANRNVGLPHCTGDVIAMTDDDAMVFPDWISRMKQLHRDHPEAGAVGGLVIGSNPETLLVKVADAMTFPRWSRECYVRTLPGVNVSYKREVVQKIGSQDESLFRGEDVDFNWRLQELGYKVLFSPDVRVYHHHRPTLKGLANQQYMYGRAYVLVRRKHPGMHSILPRTTPSPRNLARSVAFVSAAAYEPLLIALRLRGLQKLWALPLLVFLEVAWRSGMVVQLLKRQPKRPTQRMET
jgi:GT2 family glycosyltransferase